MSSQHLERVRIDRDQLRVRLLQPFGARLDDRHGALARSSRPDVFWSLRISVPSGAIVRCLKLALPRGVSPEGSVLCLEDPAGVAVDAARSVLAQAIDDVAVGQDVQVGVADPAIAERWRCPGRCARSARR